MCSLRYWFIFLEHRALKTYSDSQWNCTSTLCNHINTSLSLSKIKQQNRQKPHRPEKKKPNQKKTTLHKKKYTENPQQTKQTKNQTPQPQHQKPTTHSPLRNNYRREKHQIIQVQSGHGKIMLPFHLIFHSIIACL